jgi:hypothetical protein
MAFEIFPAARLSVAENAALDRLAAPVSPTSPGIELPTAAVLELLDGAPEPSPAPDDAPAAVDWNPARRVTVRHRRLSAELDPLSRRGWLRRDASVGWPLEVTLRTTLATVLPLEGGLPLHAAGLELDGLGFAFFGPSGAGKSTLAARAPGAVLSDEMVAVVSSGAGYELRGTGFWGTLGDSDRSALVAREPTFRLAALVALDKGEGVVVDSLARRTAMRLLIAATLVPPGPPLWSAALGAIDRMLGVVPALRLTWSPQEPWQAVASALRRAR